MNLVMEKCRRELARLLAKCINYIMALRHLISQPLLNERLQCPNGLWLTGLPTRWLFNPCNLMQLTLWQSNGVYNPIYLGCQDYFPRILPVPREV